MRGDLLEVTAKGVPTLEVKTAGRGRRNAESAETRTVPLAACYAMRDGDRYSVAVLSRKLDGKHDGQDFGDGVTAVTVRLPFRSAQTMRLHRLVGDPRATNLDAYKVKLESVDVDAAALRDGAFAVDERTGGESGGMPPGTVHVYVFEGVSR
jgi:hypothetical protein